MCDSCTRLRKTEGMENIQIIQRDNAVMRECATSFTNVSDFCEAVAIKRHIY